MEKKKNKKELIAKYKERKVVGGVFIIKNVQNNKIFIDSTANIEGRRNRFEFIQQNRSCHHPKLTKDFNTYGPEVFAFEVIEEIDKKETQTDSEFEEDVETLKEIWLEKLNDKDFY